MVGQLPNGGSIEIRYDIGHNNNSKYHQSGYLRLPHIHIKGGGKRQKVTAPQVGTGVIDIRIFHEGGRHHGFLNTIASFNE